MIPLLRKWRRFLPYLGGIAALLLFAAALVILHRHAQAYRPSEVRRALRHSSGLAAIRRVGIGRGKLFAVDPVRRAGASPHWADTAVWSRRARLLHRICLQPRTGIWEYHRPLDTLPSLHAYGTDRRRGRRNVGVRDRDVYDRARRGLSSDCAAGSVFSRDARNIAACRYRDRDTRVGVDGAATSDSAGGWIGRSDCSVTRSTFRDR